MLSLNRKLVYGFVPQILRSEEEAQKLNNLFEELIMKNNPSGVELCLDYNHKAVIYKTNVGETTLIEEYYPNGKEKLWVNNFRNKEIMLPRIPQELVEIAKECDSRNLYKFNYLKVDNVTYSLSTNRKVLVRETKNNDESLSIDLFYLGDLLA